jgi:hypothetical protein
MKVNMLEGKTIKVAKINRWGNLELLFDDGTDIEIVADSGEAFDNLILELYYTDRDGVHKLGVWNDSI